MDLFNVVWRRPPKINNKIPTPPVIQKIDPFGGKMRFYVNDPAYPALTESVADVKPDRLKISVMYLNPNEMDFNTNGGKAANAYGVLANTINFLNPKLNITKWAMVDTLQVNPLAGQQANAYYDRSFLKFFYFTKGKETVYTCLSADIVSHELGHALLDAIRPEFFSMASMEIWAFHEAFGDITAILATLHYDIVLNYLMERTNGNLRQNNIISEVAEQFGAELGFSHGLRNAFNTFNYIKPETLPHNAPNDQLSSEPHSFSRVMTGIFYDVLCGLVDKFGNNKLAIVKAREYLKDTFLEACKIAPAASNFFETFCKTWQQVDAARPESHADVLTKVFNNRNVFAVRAMSMSNVNNFEKNVTKITHFNDLQIKKASLKVQLKHIVPDAVESMGVQNLMDMNVCIPVDEMYQMQGFAPGVNEACCVDDSLNAAKYFMEYIFGKNVFGDKEGDVWSKDQENNLVRNIFQCDCFTNNCKIKGNPEYGKCWKPKNNTGCCTYGSCAGTTPIPEPKFENNCDIRYHTSCGRVSYVSNCRGFK